MFRRPLISALGAGSRRVIRPVPAQRLWQRGFASEAAAPEAEKPAQATGPRKKVIFDKTSSPELDEVLTEMLHKIILPSRLPKNKRKIIMNAKNAQKIEVDPIVIEVEGYEHRFPILDYKHATIPRSRELFWKALHLMRTREDWANLTRITSGYHRSNRLINRNQILGIVRHAGRTGNMYAVIDALRNTTESKIRIGSLPVADNALHYLQLQALDSGYAEKATRDAKTWALMLHELMEDNVHRGRPGNLRPLHREPQVIGQVLHLAAAQAVHHQSGRDEDGKVAKLAQTLALLWPRGRNLETLHPSTLPQTPGKRFWFLQESDAHLAIAVSRRISTASFILHGLWLAKQVVEPTLAAPLGNVEEALRAELDELVARRGEIKAEGGWYVYDKLIGNKA